MGVPSVIIGTDVFSKVYDASARLGGVPEIHWVKAPHPTGSLNEEQLRALARAVTPLLVDVLTQASPSTETPPDSPVTIAGGLEM